MVLVVVTSSVLLLLINATRAEKDVRIPPQKNFLHVKF